MDQQQTNNNQGQPQQFQTPPPAATPFEQPQAGQAGSASGFQPTSMEPAAKGKSNAILIVILAIILILGVLFFASWEGWVKLGGLEKYWQKNSTDSTDSADTAAVTSLSDTDTSTTAPTSTNTNDQQRKTDLANLKASLKKYYDATSAYPIAESIQKTSDASNALSALVPTYIATLPVDPLSPTNYYGYKSDGKTYEITAVLEDKTDPAGIQVGTLFIYKITE